MEFEVQQSSVVESPMSSGAPSDIHHGRLRATLRRAKAKMGGQKTRELQLAASRGCYESLLKLLNHSDVHREIVVFRCAFDS